MKITVIKIKGYKSFGPNETIIPLKNKLAAFIGLNSAGKTSALEVLKKIFGSSSSEREISRKDFHIGKEENFEAIDERELHIEVKLEFTDEDQEAVPHFFSEMVVDETNADPYLRIRLEATWRRSDLTPDGEIETKTYFIKTAEGEEELDENKKIFPNHFRSLIQILYVPAIRRPTEQLKFASGSILYRVLKKIKWSDEFKETFDSKIEEINSLFKELPEFNTVQDSITQFWQKFHKDVRYRDTLLGFSSSDFDTILKKLEISFSPTGIHKSFGIDELGEGYRSLFYLTLVCSLLDIEEKLAQENENEVIGINRPLLTILAVEEPENHIAPQLLGRIVKIIEQISEKENSQALISSHTPAIIKRLDPESILHFRITSEYETQVNPILLPDKEHEAYKYIKEAIHNYPEIYFSRLVVIGEGDSEEIIFNRLMNVLDTDFDDNIITFCPLGHRFVNHIWRLLQTLHIPYITLLDLDIGREGGGWGRIKYALEQLMQVGIDSEKLLEIDNNQILSYEDFNQMHKMELKDREDLSILTGWVKFLEKYNIYYSSPLDLDFLMLTHYSEFYKKAIPKNGGPTIPNQEEKVDEFNLKVTNAVQSTLKSEKAKGGTYTIEEKELMIWYNYHFLGRGKPTTHINALSLMDDKELKDNLPEVFKEIFEEISSLLNHK